MLCRLLAAILCIASLSSCAGYRLGNNKPSELSAINTISVDLFQNDTQEQRLATLVTNSVVDAITRDGTYKIATTSTADARLEATISNVRYKTRRSNRFDTLRASELYVDIFIKWKLVDANNKVLLSGREKGRSQFSTGSNQQTSRNYSFSDAAKNAAERITLRIANGF